MKRLLRNFLLVLLAVGLVACGPPKKSVFPPTVTVQQLQVLPSGHWQLTVRIQNNSYGEMDFNSLEGQLQIAALAEFVLPTQIADLLPTTQVAAKIPAMATDIAVILTRNPVSLTAAPRHR